MDQQPPEAELLAKAVTGDRKAHREAMARLLLRHHDAIARHIAAEIPAILRPTVAEEDILQETFTQAVRDIRRFQPDPKGSFLAWLKTIADHRLSDALKAARRKKRGGDCRRVRGSAEQDSSAVVDLVELLSAGTDTPSRAAARGENVRAIQAAIALLPDHYQEAVRLHYLQGKPIDEVAKIMNRTPGAIRGLLDRAMKIMRDILGSTSRYFSKR